jgi:SAM-dependent methyltransferase
MSDADALRRELTEYWERAAPGWGVQRAAFQASAESVSQWLIDAVDPQPGLRILELAAGPGDTGLLAAELLRPHGTLILTDISEGMLEIARARAQELGISNVEFKAMDAEWIDLPAADVDGVLCRWGYMLMAEPETALAETRRVLRDGGRLALSVWGPPEANPWAAGPRSTLSAEGHIPAQKPHDPGIFAMSSVERIRELVTGAGFENVAVEPVRIEWRFEDFDAYWRFLNELAGGIALVLERLSDEERARVRDAIERNAESFRSKGGYTFPAIALNAVAS